MDSSKFQKSLEFILDNIFDIATVLVAAYVVIRHRIQPFGPNDISQLIAWMIGILGLIAVSGFWDRNRRLRRIEKLSEESRDLVLRRLSGKVLAGDFFISQTRLSDATFSSATTIYLVGITLTRTTRQYMHILGQRLQSGAHIKLVIVDSANDSVMQEMAYRSMGNTSPEYWRTRMRTVEAVVQAIGSSATGNGKMEVGFLPYIPSFGLTMIDPDQPHGSCYVELSIHRSAEPNPTFELKALDDPHWFKFFRNQFDILWKSCRIETVAPTKP